MFTPYPSSSQEGNELSSSKTNDNWCQHVRESCQRYCRREEQPSVVTISSSHLQEMVHEIAQTSRSNKKQELVEWDQEAWHYNPPTEWSTRVRQERIALYILALDAVNFCFLAEFPESSYEYCDLATNLTKAATEDHAQQDVQPNTLKTYALSATQMASMTVERVKQILCANGKTIPLLKERCRLWNEVGQVLLQHFQGSAWNLIQQANGSAVRAVGLLVEYFPGFRDYSTQCAFLKRAQICVGDWQAALSLKWNMAPLTTFADYRLPQLLRERGVMEYAAALAERVDAREEIPANSPAEWAIRAATVVVVDELVQSLNQIAENNKEWTAVSVDWYLWQLGEKLNNQGKLRQHHRVLTTFY